jgi:hypothetical protein
MSYMFARVVVVDVRKGKLSFDSGAVSDEDRHLYNQADLIITVTNDGVFSDSNMVDVITPKSEAQLSLEKAQREAAALAERHRRPQDIAQTYRDAMSKAYRALGQSENFQPPPLPEAE